MTPRVHLAFVWHMHQPCYLDPGSAKMLLPWVRLHGSCAYRDMASLLEEHPQLRATVNLSPSLLDQIGHYQGASNDHFEEITLRPAEELSVEDQSFLLKYFFSVSWGGVLARMPTYLKLLEKRGRELPQGGTAEVVARFSHQELRDLQVLFNLSWVGFTAARDPQIQRLLAAGSGYREEDKKLVLDAQRETLQQVLPAWRALAKRGQVEVTCSPYHHPILPLLIDTSVARRSHPEVRLPERFCFAQDAETQIARAIARIEQEFGVRPQGLWPSELAVSPEVLQLASKQQRRYLIADAEILFRSLDDRGSTPGRRQIYQPYSVGQCALVFRDAALSESIAREYATWAHQEAAAAHFVERVRQVPEQARTDGNAPPLVVIALDGEPHWEAYPHRGRDFLSSLYGQLAACDDIRCLTLAEHLAEHPPTIGLEHLHSGSWIESNHAIWIGDPDKNRAWNVLGRARKRLARAEASGEVSEEVYQRAMEHILLAESSDWFWWMGEPFSSVEELIYEHLFRGHLTSVYRALGDSPPADLTRSIEHGAIVDPIRQPSCFIQPRLDGQRTSFYEWRGAGFYRVPASGSLDQPHSCISALYWGFDAGRLFLRIDPVEDCLAPGFLQGLQIWFELTEADRSLTGQLELSVQPRLLLSSKERNGRSVDLGTISEVAFVEVAELAVPLARLGLRPSSRGGLTVHFAREGVLLSRVPRQGVIEIAIPDGELTGAD